MANAKEEPIVILCLNGGSSSLKFALFRLGARKEESLLARGAVERIGLPGAEIEPAV